MEIKSMKKNLLDILSIVINDGELNLFELDNIINTSYSKKKEIIINIWEEDYGYYDNYISLEDLMFQIYNTNKSDKYITDKMYIIRNAIYLSNHNININYIIGKVCKYNMEIPKSLKDIIQEDLEKNTVY